MHTGGKNPRLLSPITFHYLGAEAFRWTMGESVFEVVPEIGARLMRWRIAGRDILHWPDTVASAFEIPLVSSSQLRLNCSLHLQEATAARRHDRLPLFVPGFQTNGLRV